MIKINGEIRINHQGLDGCTRMKLESYTLNRNEYSLMAMVGMNEWISFHINFWITILLPHACKVDITYLIKISCILSRNLLNGRLWRSGPATIEKPSLQSETGCNSMST